MKKVLIPLLTLFLFPLMGNNINWAIPSVTLSSATVAASDQHVATDSNGNVVAVWVENGLVKASIKHIGMSWSSSVTLSNTGASGPRVVSDLNGNATAIWVESGVIKAATKTLSGSWSSATTLSLSSASSPDLAVDSAGDVVAVWARSGNVETSTKLFGQSWQTRVTITSTTATTPHVAIGGTGSNTQVVAVWSGVSNSLSVVYSASKLISGSWSAQTAISNTARNAGYGAIAIDGSGNAQAVWYAYDNAGLIYSGVAVQASCKPFGASWSSATAVSATGIRNPSTLAARVAFDALGNAIALWNNSYDDMTFNIESAVKPLRGTWTAPVIIVDSNLYAYEADLAVSSLGDALTTYMFYNGAALLIQSAESNFAGFMENVWSVPINLPTSTYNSFPRIAATLTGSVINAAAVWISTNGTVNTVVGTTGTRTVVAPPTSLTVSQSSHNLGGVVIEYYNTLGWVASTNPNVVGYVIFRNGLPLEQVDSTITRFIDDNRVQSGAVTYGIAAIDNQGSQSPIATITYN